MSKSLNNIIPIFCSDNETAEYVNKIATRPVGRRDPIDPNGDTILELFRLVADKSAVHEMEEGYKSGRLGYEDSKEMLTTEICKFFSEARQRVRQFKERPHYIMAVLDDSASRVRQEMKETLGEMRELTGIGSFSRYTTQ